MGCCRRCEWRRAADVTVVFNFASIPGRIAAIHRITATVCIQVAVVGIPGRIETDEGSGVRVESSIAHRSYSDLNAAVLTYARAAMHRSIHGFLRARSNVTGFNSSHSSKSCSYSTSSKTLPLRVACGRRVLRHHDSPRGRRSMPS